MPEGRRKGGHPRDILKNCSSPEEKKHVYDDHGALKAREIVTVL